VNFYNRKVNRALRELTGEPLSPDMVDLEGERWIYAETERRNEAVMRQPGFHLKRGTRVRVEAYRDIFGRRRARFLPGVFRVLAQRGGAVAVGDAEGSFVVGRSMVFPTR
jgi:hypothetical protein